MAQRAVTAFVHLDSSGVPADVAVAAQRFKQLARAGSDVGAIVATAEANARRRVLGTGSSAKAAGLSSGGYVPGRPAKADAEGAEGGGASGGASGLRALGRLARGGEAAAIISAASHALAVVTSFMDNKGPQSTIDAVRAVPIVGEAAFQISAFVDSLSGATGAINKIVEDSAARVAQQGRLVGLAEFREGLERDTALAAARSPRARARLQLKFAQQDQSRALMRLGQNLTHTPEEMENYNKARAALNVNNEAQQAVLMKQQNILLGKILDAQKAP